MRRPVRVNVRHISFSQKQINAFIGMMDLLNKIEVVEKLIAVEWNTAWDTAEQMGKSADERLRRFLSGQAP